MIEQTETTANDDTAPELPLGPIAPRNRTLLLFAAILAVAVLGYLFLSSQTAAQRPLKPPRNTATPNVIAISSQPVIVTFAQLNEDPFALINRAIRVTGSYTPLDLPRCDGSYSGPHIVWALIAEELQLDAHGFEQIMRLVPPGTTLTIEGVWRHYEGPHGCGKEPPTATVWYLEVSRIVQPNPLPLLNGTAVPLDTIATPTFAPTDPAAQATVLVGTPLPTAAGEETDAATTPIPTATAFLTLTPTPELSPTVTTTPSPGPSPTATPSPDPSASPTPTPTATTPAGAPTATPGGNSGAPTSTPLPVQPTNTPGPGGGGYPGQPTATATTDPYP
ncbi:MAG: hypothetical protein KDE56_20555 [Anaerolineales bacterium]|nr:hypothetical protein [Anaerolineales bacterium]